MKALVQLFGAMLAAIVPLTLTNGPLSVTEWINVGVVAAGAATVYMADNDKTGGVWAYTKLFMSLVAVIGVALISALADGWVSVGEWYQIGAAALTALGVWRTPADSVGGRHAAPGAA